MKVLIGYEWKDDANREKIEVVNPATSELIATVPNASMEDVDEAVKVAEIEQKKWAKVSIYDTQTGLRAFTHLLMNFMLNIPGDRYEYEMNMLLECSKQHIQIKEIEITTIYFDNNANSHFNTLKDSYKVYRQILKFSCVSLSSFLIDYLLYIFFNLFLKNILVVNILSRLISSFWNYTLNKKIVFKEKNKSSLLRYYLLVIVILLLNTAMLGILVNYLAMNKYLAKILVEFILFILSFFIQKIFVFKAKTSDNNM